MRYRLIDKIIREENRGNKQSQSRKYNGGDFLDYLKTEEPMFYREFRRHYFEKRGAFPNMTEQQYLLWAAEKMNARARNKLESLDDSLINEGEIKRLEGIIKGSEKLSKIMEKYADIQQLSGYLPKKDKERLDKEVINSLHKNIGRNGKKQFSREKLIAIMPKLNLGPWRYNFGGGGGGDVSAIVERNENIFKYHEDMAVKILEKYYEQNDIEPEKSLRKALKKLR